MPQATFSYNDEHTKCDVEVGDCEFPDVDVSEGGMVVLFDDEVGKHYCFVVDEEGLEPDTVYELIELETAEAEDGDDDEEEEEPAPGPAAANES